MGMLGSSMVLKPFDRQPNIKSFITRGTSVPFQEINSSVMSVVKAVVNNQAKERGFFIRVGDLDVSTLTVIDYYQDSIIVNNSTIDGTMNIVFPVTAGNTINTGDLLLLKLGNETTGNVNTLENLRALPNLWFKVQSTSTSGGELTIGLDRNLPNMENDTAESVLVFYKGGEVHEVSNSETTTAQWDSGTLSFNSNININCSDIPVWNMNNVWSENLAGVTGLTSTNLFEDFTKFGSYKYLGTKRPYLEYFASSTEDSSTPTNCDLTTSSYLDNTNKSISIIHYTNNSISNLYGEFFYTDVPNGKYLSLYMPTLMYHRAIGSTGTTMGMTFVATGPTKLIPNSDIEYIDLIEKPSLIPTSATPLVIGRIYPQLKTCVIHDDEIVMANSYKSNRNWTLPELSANLESPSTGINTGVLGSTQTMYMTYILENSDNSGLLTAMPCQKYTKVTNNTASSKNVSFKISEIDLLPYMRKKETSSDGLGFYANKFKFIYQIVQNANDRPDPTQWSEVDFTSNAITVGAGEFIDPILLENQNPLITGFVLDSTKNDTAIPFSIIEKLNLPPNTEPDYLQFGDEKFFYGNLTTHIGATIYKTIFDIRVNGSEFNTTSNPTRSKNPLTNPPNIKISEVGVYDSTNTLVCIGKLSNPVSLIGNNTIMLEISMDF